MNLIHYVGSDKIGHCKVINKTITTEYPIFRQPTSLIFKDLDSFSPCDYALLSSYHARHPFSEDESQF